MSTPAAVASLAPRAWRHRLIVLLLAGGASVVLGRAFYLQVLENGFLSHQGTMRFVRTMTLPGLRGAILASDGTPLALSAPVKSIWAIPADLLAAPRYLPALADLLDEPEPELKRFLEDRKDLQFVYLKRQLAPSAADRILALHAPGVSAQQSYRRYYPAGAVAAQLVGFTDIDGKGQAGVELTDNDVLHGVDGKRRVIRDGSGRIVQDTNVYDPAKPGRNLHLTLDLQLQYVAYRELQAAVTAHQAKSGSMVIVNPRSGAVLALANVPSFNPNDPAQRVSPGVKDLAVTNTFEPGSSIKPLLVARALEMGTITPQTRIATDGGAFRVGPMVINDDSDFGTVTPYTLLQKSSNIAAAKIGLTLGPEALWQGYSDFGLGRITGVGLPGEAQPTLRPWQSWRDVATATASYGYGVAFTALQMVRAYSAIANDGLMPQLHLDAEGTPTPPVRVLPAGVARTVRDMLQSVPTPEGTAPGAAVPGYHVAGKTGTSRMVVDGKYAPGKYHAIFIGMLPAERPRLVAMVIINAPKGWNYYGGSVAGPVFSKVMSAAARMMQIAPDDLGAGQVLRVGAAS